MSYVARRLAALPPETVRGLVPDGDNRVDRWPPARCAAYAANALHDILVHAFEASPFYRERFQHAGVDPRVLVLPRDLARVPVLDKDELRGRPWALLAVPRERVSQIHVSTGTTGGDEIYVPHTWEDLYVRSLAPAMRRLVPVGVDDVVLNALPYEMSSAGLAFHRTFQRACGAAVIPAGKGGYYSTPALAARMTRDLGATVAVTTPSYAVQIAEAAVAQHIDLAGVPLRFLWLTGEGCSSAFRARVERAWGHAAYFYYGSLEAGPIGIECGARDGYHIAAGHVFVEVVELATCRACQPGDVGEVLVTELTRRGAPLVRYRTGDLAYLDTAPCACGVTLPRLHLRGRDGDELTVAGRTLSPLFVEELLMSVDGVGDWYELAPRSHCLVVRVEPARGVTPTPALAESARSRIEYGVGVPVEVQFATVPRPRGKVARVRPE